MANGVEIRVRSNSQQARQDLSKLEKSVGNINNTVKGVTKSLTRMAAGLAAAFAGQAAIKGINRTTNSLTELENRIALVTGRTQELNTTLKELYEISARSRGAIDGAAETFNRFGRALQGSGTSTEDLLKATEAVQKSIAISGSSAESARAAIFQLGQGLASGQLRGQELNSVLEQAPRLAQAIADSLGQPLGALRVLAEQGKITTDVVFKGLLSQSDQINSEFEDLEATSSQAFTVMSDALGQVVGNISRTLDITYKFTDAFLTLGNYLRQNVAFLDETAFIMRYQVTTAFEDFLLVAGGIANVFGAYFGRIGDAIYQIIAPMRTVSDQIKAFLVRPFLEARQQYRKLANKMGDEVADQLMSGLRGKIGNVFRAEGPEEIRVALDELAAVIDGYGRQWWNFGNKLTNVINPAMISIERTLVGLGLIDQRLLRFRSGSFEDLNFVMELTNLIITDLVKNIKALDIWTDMIYGGYIAFQQINRIMNAIESEVKINVNKVQETLSRMFVGAKTLAEEELKKAWGSVKYYLNLIERKFFWLYDEVIANSWWTDLMVQTASLASFWLAKAELRIKMFGDVVNGVYEKISARASDMREALADIMPEFGSRSFEINISASSIKDSVLKFGEGAYQLVKDLAKATGQIAADIYNKVKEVVPGIGSLIAFAVTSAVGSAFAPKTFAPLLTLEFVGLGAFIANEMANTFGAAIISSGFFEDLGVGIGRAAGNFVNAILQNIPKITQAFIQIVKGFGQGVADAIGGIPGFLLRMINSIPFFGGDGLIVGIIFGSAGLALVSKKFRELAFTVIAPALSSIAKMGKVGAGGDLFGSGQGIVSGLLLGTKNDPKAILSRVAFVTLGASALLSGIPDSLGQGIAQLGFAYLTMFGTRGPGAVISDLQGLASKATTTFEAINKGGFGEAMGTRAALVFNKIKGMFNSTAVTATISAAKTETAYTKAFTKISLVGGKSFLSLRKNMLMTAGVAGGLIFALSSAAEAGVMLGTVSEESGSKLQAFALQVATVGTSALFLFDILKKVGVTDVFSKVFGGIAKSSAAKAASSALLSMGTRVAAGLATAFAGIGSALLSGFLAAIGTIASAIFSIPAAIAAAVAGTIGLVYVAIFGEGDSIFERISNVGTAIKKMLGFVDRDAKQTRKTVEDLLDFKKIGDIEIDLQAKLKLADLASATSAEREQLVKVSRAANKIFEDAQETYIQEGELSRAEIRQVKRATLMVERAIRGMQPPEEAAKRTEVLGVGIEGVIEKLTSRPDLFGMTPEQGQLLATTDFRGADLQAMLTELDLQGIPELLQASQIDTVRQLGQSLSYMGEALRAGMAESFSDEEIVSFNETLTSLFKRVDENFNMFVSGRGGFANFGIDSYGFKKDLDTLSKLIEDQHIEDKLINRANLIKRIQGVFEEVGKAGVELDPEEDLGFFSNEELLNMERIIKRVGSAQEELANSTGGQLETMGARRVLEYQIQKFEEYITTIKDGAVEAETPLQRINNLLEAADVGEVQFFTPQLYVQATALYNRMLSYNMLLKDNEDLTSEAAEAAMKGYGQSKTYLEGLVKLENDRVMALTDTTAYLEEALSKVEDSVSLDKVINMDPATIQRVIDASLAVDRLALSIQALSMAGEGGAIREVLRKQMKEQQDILDDLLGGGDDKKKSGNKKTFLEKLQEGLSSAGFSANIQEIGAMSQKQIDKLSEAVTRYNAAQKALNNSAREEASIRKSALETLNTQRERMAEILASGTILGVQKALEGMGSQLDIASLVGLTPEKFQFAIENSLRISELKKQLLETDGQDLDLAKQINRELQYRMTLEQGITDAAASSTAAISDSIKENLGQVIRGAQTFGEAILGVMDTVTNRIIDTVVNSFVDAMFQQSGMQDMFTNFFGSLFQSGQSVGAKLGKTLGDSVTDGMGEAISGGGFMSKLGGFLKGIGSKISGMLGGLFGGGGGGGFFGSLLSFGSTIFGFSEGGMVPMVAGAKAGVDSVPAMLTPGEIVLSTAQVKALGQGGMGGNSQVFNINVSGDVSRQTRKEIVKMMPQITQGVNSTNRENNRR